MAAPNGDLLRCIQKNSKKPNGDVGYALKPMRYFVYLIFLAIVVLDLKIFVRIALVCLAVLAHRLLLEARSGRLPNLPPSSLAQEDKFVLQHWRSA